MKSKIYDAIIIGGGVIGCAIARFLSRYNGNFLVLEKHNDVGDETSSANSAIVHSGYDPEPGTLKAKFNVLGNKMMEKVCNELDVTFKKIGSLTIGFNEDDKNTLLKLLERAHINGVEASIIDQKELHLMEPNLNKEATVGLYCKDAGIVNPFTLTVSLMENAMDNGCELLLNTEVVNFEKRGEFCRVFCKNNEFFDTKEVINAAGVNSDKFAQNKNFKITPRKGQYILFDHFNNNFVNHVLFMCPNELGKGVLFSPTTSGNYFIGPNSEECEKDDTSTSKEGFDFIKKEARKLIPNLPLGETIREFSGVRANSDYGDFIIEEDEKFENLINVASIMSPGLASSVAIGEYVSNLVKEKLNLTFNSNYNPYIKKHIKLENLDNLNNLINDNPENGEIICRCEKVSKAMIKDVIHRNCGATTVKGVKKRTRAGFGKCQGTFCQDQVIEILSDELNIPIDKILYSEKGTEILKFKAKE